MSPPLDEAEGHLNDLRHLVTRHLGDLEGVLAPNIIDDLKSAVDTIEALDELLKDATTTDEEKT